MLSQKLQQKLQQKLSPQQIQLMKLIQIPTIALEQRVKQEIEENPALEEAADNEQVDHEEEFGEGTDGGDEYEDNGNDDHDDFNIEDYLDDDDIPAYKLSVQNKGKDDDSWEVPVVSGVSFNEHLQNQAGMFSLDERRKTMLDVIIGNIDDSGYLERELQAIVNDLAFSYNIATNTTELEELLKLVHKMEPPGVGARNLQECLSIQLNRSEEDLQAVKLAKTVIDSYFEEFSKKHYDKILKKTGVTEDELKEAVSVILKLNPKPGNALGDSTRGNLYIVPDFYVTCVDGVLDLKIHQKNKPELRISKAYRNMLEQYSGNSSKDSVKQKEALQFVRQKIDSAKWFIDAINQREHTLLVTMSAIMEYQKEYFQTGDKAYIKPMILKYIADMVELDISTISRVANSKYVQTPYSTILLKTLFSEALQTESGQEVSTIEVKKTLEDFIEKEDKRAPLTDDMLAAMLKEKGYTIARRTVAKYRELMGIPVARLRREL